MGIYFLKIHVPDFFYNDNGMACGALYHILPKACHKLAAILETVFKTCQYPLK